MADFIVDLSLSAIVRVRVRAEGVDSYEAARKEASRFAKQHSWTSSQIFGLMDVGVVQVTRVQKI